MLLRLTYARNRLTNMIFAKDLQNLFNVEEAL